MVSVALSFPHFVVWLQWNTFHSGHLHEKMPLIHYSCQWKKGGEGGEHCCLSEILSWESWSKELESPASTI